MQVMHYEVFSGSLQEIDLTKQGMVIDTISPHSYTMAKFDRMFKEALRNSDILLPDGHGIVLAVDVLFNENIHRIAGSDMHEHLLKHLQKIGGRAFYMGAKQETLIKIKERLGKDFPSIEMESFSPPFKQKFSQLENLEIINRINEFDPDVLFVGMTAPKQEKWVHEHKHLLKAKIICCIGAVFDFFAGTVKRSGSFWINHGLEWLPRFVRDPRRLWRRIFVSIPAFMMDVYLYKLKILR